MDPLDFIREKLNPRSAYMMKNGPFGDNTLLLVLEDENPDIEKLLSEVDIDFDLAVVTEDEFEKIKDVVEESGERLW